MPKVDRPRVLLLWPGGLFGGGANFGIPQMLSIAGACRRAGAEVDVVDLDLERALGPVDLARIVARGGPYDLVGISCYSSYDYLKVMEIGAALRRLLPRAWLATGGYHPSARPNDFTRPGSPFDFVVVSDGELPMARLVSALVTGRRPLQPVIGPESVPDPNELEPIDWDLLGRYRNVARKVASQAEIYLSRGCPFDCAFCMERAKRDVSWRPFEPERALEELHRLDRFLDLSRLDAVHRRRALRHEEVVAAGPARGAGAPAAAGRQDLAADPPRSDRARGHRADGARQRGPGFGLESGDPGAAQAHPQGRQARPTTSTGCCASRGGPAS